MPRTGAARAVPRSRPETTRKNRFRDFHRRELPAQPAITRDMTLRPASITFQGAPAWKGSPAPNRHGR